MQIIKALSAMGYTNVGVTFDARAINVLEVLSSLLVIRMFRQNLQADLEPSCTVDKKYEYVDETLTAECSVQTGPPAVTKKVRTARG